MTLGEYILRNGNMRRVDGQHDCVTFPANWAIECGYYDPMAKWRGAYSTEAAALALIEKAGGLVALFDDGLHSVDIRRREGEPQEGDIGVVSLAKEEAGAIYTGKRWAIVLERGLGMVSLSRNEIAAVWAVL